MGMAKTPKRPRDTNQLAKNIVDLTTGDTEEEIITRIAASGKGGNLSMIHIETPANPTNALIDIEMCARIKKHFSTKDKEVVLSVDNTYMGPLWQHPLAHGADLVLYSATKYIGGHSDVIAGACLGSKELIARVKGLRTFSVSRLLINNQPVHGPAMFPKKVAVFLEH